MEREQEEARWRLIPHLLRMSEGYEFEAEKLKWRFISNEKREKNNGVQCICQRENIYYSVSTYYNIENGYTIYLGSKCEKHLQLNRNEDGGSGGRGRGQRPRVNDLIAQLLGKGPAGTYSNITNLAEYSDSVRQGLIRHIQGRLDRGWNKHDELLTLSVDLQELLAIHRRRGIPPRGLDTLKAQVDDRIRGVEAEIRAVARVREQAVARQRQEAAAAAERRRQEAAAAEAQRQAEAEAAAAVRRCEAAEKEKEDRAHRREDRKKRMRADITPYLAARRANLEAEQRDRETVIVEAVATQPLRNCRQCGAPTAANLCTECNDRLFSEPKAPTHHTL